MPVNLVFKFEHTVVKAAMMATEINAAIKRTNSPRNTALRQAASGVPARFSLTDQTPATAKTKTRAWKKLRDNLVHWRHQLEELRAEVAPRT